ncbi:TatD family deoxyribonuclease [Psychromonas sp. MB-3u-54]|uniref:TatD family hydrolase n=1 Tax=Psychromonas sp. MB-3u-54 TaxID=2058319 RepID=UPI000C341E27|nr:TatD family hydrolase [Psychromonas sp. MB-3u-54]PKH03397.1 TatD family deoxyribonuclease [Psychromonas sp. MB-3u-54]
MNLLGKPRDSMFIDSHCHLNFACFDIQRERLLQQLQQNKITKVIIPATHRGNWEQIIELCENHSNLYYALGYHPHFLDDFKPGDLQYLQTLLEHKNMQCVALGEIGLDKFIKTPMEVQESIFTAQLAIAQQLELPVILHVVKKQGRVLEILRQLKFTQGGVYHAFSGSYELALEFIKLGFKIGVGGVITYPNSITTRETISLLPLESLVLETDAPGMPIYQQAQSDNTPLNLLHIFESLAMLRVESKKCLASQLYNNTRSLFSLDND